MDTQAQERDEPKDKRPPGTGSQQRRGLGAQADSSRQEFRKFRGDGAMRGSGSRSAGRGRGTHINVSNTQHEQLSQNTGSYTTVTLMTDETPMNPTDGKPFNRGRGRGLRRPFRGRGRGGENGIGRQPTTVSKVLRNLDKNAVDEVNGQVADVTGQAETNKVSAARMTRVSEKTTNQKPKGSSNRERGARRDNRVCRFFSTPEGCLSGEKCRFKHQDPILTEVVKNAENAEAEGTITVLNGTTTGEVVVPVLRRPLERIGPPRRITVSKEQRGSEQATAQRNSDITYIKRRFLKDATIEDLPSGEVRAEFFVAPTDPEWPFDVRSVYVIVEFPKDYPLEPCQFKVDREQKNPCMPDVLCNYINDEAKNIITEKYSEMERANAFEGIVKWFLKVFDRKLFTFFLNGLRRTKMVVDAEAAGIFLVVPAKSPAAEKEDDQKLSENLEKVTIEETLQEAEEENCDSESSSSDEETDDHIGAEDQENNEGQGDEDDDRVYIGITTEALPSDVQLPIEVLLVWNDKSGNIASLIPQRLHICTRCSRCKEQADHEVGTDGKQVGWRCARCSCAHSIRLKGELVHENSSVLGRMDAVGCVPIDCIMRNTRMKFVCLACNQVDEVQNLNFGEQHMSWCKKCHTVCEFDVSAIRFRGDMKRTLMEDSDFSRRIPKPKKKADVVTALSEGNPLPDYGACKHYKKSHRWFRFPCCGKVYPCDVCHEDKEGGHEMKLANRMICGFCSKEQAFMKSKPCIGCGENVIRASSRFWEGGKGCRDQSKLNRNDTRKHQNSRMKTVSKKKFAHLATKKKPEK